MSARLNFWYYWNVTRRSERWFAAIVHALPRKVKYQAVIDVGAEVTTRPPLENVAVPTVTLLDVLNTYEVKK
jgi:hypothetical protein